MNFSEISLSEVVEFARLKSAGNTKREKNCSKGWSCGFTCLPRTKKNCNNPLEGQSKTLTEWLKKNAPEPSQKPVRVPSEKEASMSFRVVGEGAFGVVYRDGDSVYKYSKDGRMESSEVEIATKAGELGVGPKVLGSRKEGYAMEFLSGYEPLCDLAYSLDAYKKLGDTNAIAHGILDNAEKLHKAGIAHLDMHSGNTMVDKKTGKVRIIDYGLASEDPEDVVEDIQRFKRKRRWYLTETVDGDKLTGEIDKLTDYYNNNYNFNKDDLMKKVSEFYDNVRGLNLAIKPNAKWVAI